MHALANPARFLRFARPATTWLLLIGLALAVVGMIAGLTLTPPDYLQGETVRILYIHVPSAWLGMAGWVGIAAASVSQLVWRHPLAAVAGRAIAPAGATFAAICLHHRLDLGTPDLGNLVGMGRPADVDARAVLPVPRLHRVGLCRAGARRGRAHRGDLWPRRRNQPADHPLFRPVVANASPRAEHRPHRLDDRQARSCGRCR